METTTITARQVEAQLEMLTLIADQLSDQDGENISEDAQRLRQAQAASLVNCRVVFEALFKATLA